MTLVYLGTALWAVWIINHLCHQFADWVHRPHTPTDDYCSSLDQEWDELEARRAIRPHGNCEVIYGPWVRENPTVPPTIGPFDRSGGAA